MDTPRGEDDRFLSSAFVPARQGRPQTAMACPTWLVWNVQLFRGHITSHTHLADYPEAPQPAARCVRQRSLIRSSQCQVIRGPIGWMASDIRKIMRQAGLATWLPTPPH